MKYLGQFISWFYRNLLGGSRTSCLQGFMTRMRFNGNTTHYKTSLVVKNLKK